MPRYIVLPILLLAGCTSSSRETSISAQASTLCYSFAFTLNVKEVCK